MPSGLRGYFERFPTVGPALFSVEFNDGSQAIVKVSKGPIPHGITYQAMPMKWIRLPSETSM